MRACELAARLADDAENVARQLLPNGRREGHEWVCGDLDGSAGHSLKVRLAGTKAGVWKDFATDDGGDLIGLWMHTGRMDLREACAQAAIHLGIQPVKVENPKRTYTRPNRDGVEAIRDPVMQWLQSVRKITPDTAKTFKLACKKGALMFPYIRDGELIFAKYRAVPEKKFWTEADCEPALFGWQAIPADTRVLIIVEGELDALAMYEYGFPALSVPFGGGTGDKQAWIEHEFDRLAVYDEIILALDADDAGRAATDEIVKRLGRERCRIATLPRKDANQCLIDGVPGADIAACVRNAKTLDPESLKSASEFTDAVLREFDRLQNGETGLKLPWRKVGDHLILRRGEVSVWAGINGHGKSEVCGHIVLGALTQGSRCCVASMEFRPEKWLRRMVRQAAASAFPSAAHIRHVMQQFRDKMWVYAESGTTKGGSILESFRYATKRYGVSLFCIDNLAKCGIAEDDYQGQKAFVDALTDFARDYDVHVMLVAHTKKPSSGIGEDKPPEKHDIKGTGAITDMVDTVVTIWRNKPKEKLIATGQKKDSDLRNDPDCILVCSKQRNGEHEPRIGLWFDRNSHQYNESADSSALPIMGMREAV